MYISRYCVSAPIRFSPPYVRQTTRQRTDGSILSNHLQVSFSWPRITTGSAVHTRSSYVLPHIACARRHTTHSHSNVLKDYSHVEQYQSSVETHMTRVMYSFRSQFVAPFKPNHNFHFSTIVISTLVVCFNGLRHTHFHNKIVVV